MEKKSSQKTKQFFKKNVYYIIMAVCLLAIAAMITVTVLINNGVIGNKAENPGDTVLKPDDPIQNPDDPTVKPDDPTENPGDPTVKPDDPTPIEPGPVAVVFALPVASANVTQVYSMDALVWNPTLKHYAVHNGIDFSGADGDNVLAAYDGVVTNITYDVLNGHTVTIKHNDALSTVYSSLNEPSVIVGQTVRQGNVIGTMGVTATAEYSSGAHLHFSALENGEAVNPEIYMAMTDNK